MKAVDKVIRLMKNMKHLNMHCFIMSNFQARKSANFLEAVLVSSHT